MATKDIRANCNFSFNIASGTFPYHLYIIQCVLVDFVWYCFLILSITLSD